MKQNDGLAIFISNEIMAIDDLSFLEKGVLAKIQHLDNENHCFASNKYLADYFGVSERTIIRALNNLESKGYISKQIENNCKRIIEGMTNCHTPMTECHTPMTNCHTNNIENNISNNINIKGIKGNFDTKGAKSNTQFSIKLLEKQMRVCATNIDIDDNAQNTLIHILDYYYGKYYKVFGTTHPILSNMALKKVIDKYVTGSDMVEGYTDYSTYIDLIDQHFQTRYKNCDYNICHFFTDGVLDNRFFESSY